MRCEYDGNDEAKTGGNTINATTAPIQHMYQRKKTTSMKGKDFLFLVCKQPQQ